MSASYPNLLASGVTIDNTFAAFELWAGEADLVTSQGTAGAAIQQFQVVMRDALNRTVVPWTGHGPAEATGTITFSSAVPSAADSVTINGTAITFRASGATGYDVNIPGSLALTATAVRDMVNAHEDVFGVSATASGGVVTLTSVEPGENGNAATLAKSGTNIAVSAATLSGGSDQGGKAIGFAAQAAVVGGPVAFYTGGVPNHLALVWPAGVSTLDARKAAFDGSNITVSSLI